MDPDTHVSDLRWDRLLAGELADLPKTAALAHAAACPACAARLAALTAEQQAFTHRARFVAPGPAIRGPGSEIRGPGPEIRGPEIRGPGPRRSRRWAIASSSVAAIAAAAIAILVIRARSHDEPGDEPGERPKGGATSLVLAGGPQGRLAPVASGDRIHPGDYVQAAYTAARDGFGAVLSRDGTGKAMAYVPPGGDTMVALPAGTLRSFPASTVLDAVVGEEAVVVLWCPAPHPLAPLLRELAATGALAAPAGCAVHRAVLDKRAESP
jgi:hypothetical protein